MESEMNLAEKVLEQVLARTEEDLREIATHSFWGVNAEGFERQMREWEPFRRRVCREWIELSLNSLYVIQKELTRLDGKLAQVDSPQRARRVSIQNVQTHAHSWWADGATPSFRDHLAKASTSHLYHLLDEGWDQLGLYVDRRSCRNYEVRLTKPRFRRSYEMVFECVELIVDELMARATRDDKSNEAISKAKHAMWVLETWRLPSEDENDD